MAVDTPTRIPAVSVAPRASGRIERAVHSREDAGFIARMRVTNGRALLLVRGGLDVEAYRMLEAQRYEIDRRARQLGLDPDPEGSAA